MVVINVLSFSAAAAATQSVEHYINIYDFKAHTASASGLHLYSYITREAMGMESKYKLA